MSQAQTQPAFRVAPLIFLVIIFFLSFLARMVFSPLLLAIEEDFGISHAQAGTFFLIISIGFSVMIFFSGFVSKQLRHRGTILVSVFGIGGALILIAVSHRLIFFQAGLCLLGMSAGLYIPSGISTLTSLTAAKHWGKAISFHEFGGLAGFVLAPIFAEIGLRAGSWRLTLLAFAAATLLTGVLYLLFGKGGGFRGETPHLRNIKITFRKKSFRILAIFFIVAVGLEIGVFAMLPTYLVVERGMGRGFVNTIVGLSRSSTLIFVFFSGWMVDRFGVKALIGWISGLAGVCTILLGVLDNQWIVPVVFLQPLVISAFFPVAITALADVSTARTRNVTISLIIPFSNSFGAGLVPVAMGFMAERGLFAAGFIIVGTLMIACLVLLPQLRVTSKG